MGDGRRVVLYHPKYVEGFRVALREARADLVAMHERHLAELADLRAEVAELRSILADVVRLSREKAEGDLVALRRQLETALGRLERRDPAQPLH